MTPHRVYVYGDPSGAQIAVEVWPDGIDVKVRPDASAIWGLPLEQVSVEGPAVMFAFEEEKEPVTSTAQLDMEDRFRR
jgi:hypothetical protein